MKPKNQTTIINESEKTNLVQLGNLILSSPYERIDQLILKLKDILADNNVQDYLRNFERKKASMPGVG